MRVLSLAGRHSCLYRVPRWQRMPSSSHHNQLGWWLVFHRHAARTQLMVWPLFALGTCAVSTPACVYNRGVRLLSHLAKKTRFQVSRVVLPQAPADSCSPSAFLVPTCPSRSLRCVGLQPVHTTSTFELDSITSEARTATHNGVASCPTDMMDIYKPVVLGAI